MAKQDLNATIQQQIAANTSGGRFGYNWTPTHSHTGLDSPRVSYLDLEQRQFTATSVVFGASAATAANFGPFWIAPFDCSIQEMQQAHSSNGSAGTLFVEILRPGQASGGGTAVVSFDMTVGANQVATSTLRRSGTAKILKAGDRLSLFMSGTPTGLAQVVVTVLLQAV